MLTWVSMSPGRPTAYARSTRLDLWPPGSSAWARGGHGWLANWEWDQQYLPYMASAWDLRDYTAPGTAEALILAGQVVYQDPAPVAWEWVSQ